MADKKNRICENEFQAANPGELGGDVVPNSRAEVTNAVLRQWVQPRHLLSGNVSQYAEVFMCHPARLIAIKEFLREEWARELSEFLIHGVRYETRYALHPGPSEDKAPVKRGRHVRPEEWCSASPVERFFAFGSPAGFAGISPSLGRYMEFVAMMVGPAFRHFVEIITRSDLGSMSVEPHRMEEGEFIRFHSDARSNRRMGIILYLSPGWHPGNGGLYNIRSFGGHEMTILPEFNSMLIFDVAGHLEHEVTDVHGKAVRISFNGWLHEPTADLKSEAL